MILSIFEIGSNDKTRKIALGVSVIGQNPLAESRARGQAQQMKASGPKVGFGQLHR
jgi:hypothetical protein